jgi:glycogen debranching enzyme
MAEAHATADQFAILTEVERARAQSRVLMHGDSFAVFDQHGDVIPAPGSEHGLYHRGTRFLSRFELLIGNRQPLLLSSAISDDNVIFAADLTNPDTVRGDRVVVCSGVLHLFRSRVVWNGGWTESVRATNHGLEPFEVPLTFRFDADFADVFEVRGVRRASRGQRLRDPDPSSLTLRYCGLDGLERRTAIRCNHPPDRVTDGSLLFLTALAPHASLEVEISVNCEVEREAAGERRQYADMVAARRHPAPADAGACSVLSSNHAFNRWLQRSTADLQMMIADTPYGPYPYAGIPWFSTPFGRDGIVTAFERLWADPSVARGVLNFLAETQATTVDDAKDAQPGKILHEMRDGEMAALGEIPFGRYYGSADATPLFVALTAAYYERTGDLPFIERLWPHLLAALDWMDRYGDPDGDGFIEYARRTASGLVQQGWKDSWDSIFHADGSLAEPPIALCEIQGYAYAAWTGAARLASARGDEAQAARWHERGATLQARFEQAFWCDDLGLYAIALDAGKRPCRVRSSNPGHCLFSGIAAPPRARRVAEALLSQSSFTGWGVRTVAAGESRYNPMSYHDGSVWPHDNAIVAAGFARYGLTSDAARICGAMFDLSRAVDLHRLPELICGFHRRASESPTLYPVACAPQAWAAGAAFLLIQACLGLTVDATARRITLAQAVLPEEIEWLRITNLAVGDASVDLLLTRHASDVGITVLRRTGDVAIVATK